MSSNASATWFVGTLETLAKRCDPMFDDAAGETPCGPRLPQVGSTKLRPKAKEEGKEWAAFRPVAHGGEPVGI